MHEIDDRLLEYIKPLMPEYEELIGYCVIDSENLRIWFWTKDKKKKCFMIAAP